MNDQLKQPSMIDKVIRFSLENKLIVFLVVLIAVAWGLRVAPFDWYLGRLPRDPVPVDAIPDTGENQQIVFTRWPGRSPQDVEDQITSTLTDVLMGTAGVKTVRSSSMFGFSSIYVIFKEDVDFYWSRSRVLEKLNSLPGGALPEEVQPMLGPDATALGQVFWYTLEGRDEDDKPTGGWDLAELRSIQDWDVRFALLSAGGISEVASVGGFVKEYQVDVDPDAMRANNVALADVTRAVKNSNVDVGARTIEVNSVEYVIRGLGFIKGLRDLEYAVVKVNDNVPIYVKNVANVALGPALRRGALDKEGAEAVGGVAVVRYGENPLAAIKNVKKKIAKIAPGLPSKVIIDYEQTTRGEIERFAVEHDFEAFDGADLDQDAWTEIIREMPREERPAWSTLSQVKIVPFYDRTGLIYETLGTLKTALTLEILVTIVVVLVMVMHLRSSLLISAMLPLAILICFIAMKTFHVGANIVALSGIAIAIGTIVDMGIIICENILKHLDLASPSESRLEVIYRASSEVAGAVLTAVATTVISFLPVFTLVAEEGKMFRPLAFTKTFALIASVVVALTLIPPLAHILFAGKIRRRILRFVFHGVLFAAGIVIALIVTWWAGAIIALIALYHLVDTWIPDWIRKLVHQSAAWLAAIVVALLLTEHWLPLGPEKGLIRNLVFVALFIGGFLAFFKLFQLAYAPILRWCLDHKAVFLAIPVVMIILALNVWLGFNTFFGWLPNPIKSFPPVSYVMHKFPGLGREFMPPLDEGSFLFMPTVMPHASIGEAFDVLQKQDCLLYTSPSPRDRS